MSDQQSLPPNYFYHQLPNGIEMIGQYMPSLSSITFGLQLDAAVNAIVDVEDRGRHCVALVVIVEAVDPRPAEHVQDAQVGLGDGVDHAGLGVSKGVPRVGGIRRVRDVALFVEHAV